MELAWMDFLLTSLFMKECLKPNNLLRVRRQLNLELLDLSKLESPLHVLQLCLLLSQITLQLSDSLLPICYCLLVLDCLALSFRCLLLGCCQLVQCLFAWEVEALLDALVHGVVLGVLGHLQLLCQTLNHHVFLHQVSFQALDLCF